LYHPAESASFFDQEHLGVGFGIAVSERETQRRLDHTRGVRLEGKTCVLKRIEYLLKRNDAQSVLLSWQQGVATPSPADSLARSARSFIPRTVFVSRFAVGFTATQRAPPQLADEEREVQFTRRRARRRTPYQFRGQRGRLAVVAVVDLDHVEAVGVGSDGSDHVAEFAGLEAERLHRSGPRRVSGIGGVDIDTQVDLAVRESVPGRPIADVRGRDDGYVVRGRAVPLGIAAGADAQ